jgi:hypothetical protein
LSSPTISRLPMSGNESYSISISVVLGDSFSTGLFWNGFFES